MLRKAYVPGVAALLAALLTGCTGGSGGGTPTDDANPGEAGTATAAAQPGRYRTLPEPCGAVGQGTLDSLLPGIKEITDEDQREKAYAGEATLTYDTDRKVGCRWKVQSAAATDHLLVDLERVVSYDNSVSDDSQAQDLFAALRTAADLPEPTGSATADTAESTSKATSKASSKTTSKATSKTASQGRSTGTSKGASDGSAAAAAGAGAGSGAAEPGASSSVTPSDLQPRVLDGLGDEAFLDDELDSSGSTAQRRTVTVAFRTSNVIVTIEYEEQPAAVGVVPDSKEMQDKARKLAAQLADALAG
ncbi:DUF3558 domain-containing protein [Streptomyces sp. NPDC000987]|uniref:DUF3558 domain-containing protein n=1 Tax=Streptomyces sp. NPDC000987 TaxID=3154374 RepID=UPI00332261FE